jgi:asparagine synthase (glutamine-hydrolysing)
MCGIAGIVSRDDRAVDASLLSNMLQSLAHRGPDGAGMSFKPQIALGTRRLAIVDEMHGAQPCWSEDGSVVSILNGEIFNFKELRQDLVAAGVKLRTQCDAEILPHLYDRHGANFVDLLNGQFAIALYDFRQRRFLAWRDPFGICPLFYMETSGQLVFGSEIKAILSAQQDKPRLDLLGLDQIFTFPGPVSPRTLFDGIRALPPGHVLDMRAGQEIRVSAYWDLTFPAEASQRNFDDWVDELENLLLDAVRIRAPDETRVGLYLSGGLDSSLVGALLRACRPESPIHSFSIDFEDTLVSEGQHQAVMVEALAARHSTAKLGSAEVLDRLKQVIWHTETPLRESFNAASLALSEMARDAGLKAVLAGQGADELFAGYVGYRFDARGGRTITDNMEASVNERLWGDPQFTYERNYGTFVRERTPLYASALRNTFDEFNCTSISRPLRPLSSDLSKLQRRSYVDVKMRLADHLLSGHGDRMAMANSIEVRYPFLDMRVANLARSMPDQVKLNNLTEKYVVKAVGSRWLPNEIVARQKFGFTAPGSPTLLTLNDQYVEHCLSTETIQKQGLFDPEMVAHLKERYGRPGFRIAVPYQSDLLMTVLTCSMFMEIFDFTDL